MYGSSDPILGKPSIAGQFGQVNPWMTTDQTFKATTLFCPCGRLREAPEFFTLTPTWTSFDPITKKLILPSDELLSCFNFIVLQRDAIRKFVPDPNSPFWAISHKYSPFPRCVYLYAHWLTPILGRISTNQENILFNTRWVLFYGDVSGLLSSTFADPSIHETLLLNHVFDLDSHWVDSNPSSMDSNVISGQGWGLFLISTQFDLEDVSDPTVSFSIYSGYQLDPDSTQMKVASKNQIFDATVWTTWKQFHNALALPAHNITLKPLGQ